LIGIVIYPDDISEVVEGDLLDIANAMGEDLEVFPSGSQRTTAPWCGKGKGFPSLLVTFNPLSPMLQ